MFGRAHLGRKRMPIRSVRSCRRLGKNLKLGEQNDSFHSECGGLTQWYKNCGGAFRRELKEDFFSRSRNMVYRRAPFPEILDIPALPLPWCFQVWWRFPVTSCPWAVVGHSSVWLEAALDSDKVLIPGLCLMDPNTVLFLGTKFEMIP